MVRAYVIYSLMIVLVSNSYKNLAFCRVYPKSLSHRPPPMVLATVSKHPETLAILEQFIPWEDLAVFFASIPKNIHASQGLHVPAPTGTERWVMLTSSCAPLLPEDWCLRGMGGVGCKVFEHGYWKRDRSVGHRGRGTADWRHHYPRRMWQ